MEGISTTAAVEERGKLRRHFGRADILFYLICTIVGLDTIGSVATHGAAGFTWLAFLGLLFFIPYGLLTAELGSTFTEEGGPYVWTRLAFGRFTAAVNAVLYWVSNPIWVGGTLTITAVTAFDDFFFPLSKGGKYLFALAFIWLSVLAAVVSFRWGKWIPTLSAWTRAGVLGFFTFTVARYATEHGVHGFGGHDFLPTYAGFIAVVPVLVFNYVGFELPSAAGEEMKQPQRDVPFAVGWSALGALLLYGVPILAILLVLPPGNVTGLGGFLDAIKAVFVVYGGYLGSDGIVHLAGAGKVLGQLMAVAFIVALAGSGTTWLMGADRALAVAAYDGAGPRFLGRFSARFGTPVTANLLSGFLSTVVMVLAFELSQGDANRYFTAVLGLAISTTTISYLAIFPTLVRLRMTHPDVPRPYRVPGGPMGAWICAGLTTCWALLATLGLLWPGFGVGWFGSPGSPEGALPEGFRGQRLAYELTQIVPLLAIFSLGVVFYALGRRTRDAEAA